MWTVKGYKIWVQEWLSDWFERWIENTMIWYFKYYIKSTVSNNPNDKLISILMRSLSWKFWAFTEDIGAEHNKNCIEFKLN